MTERDHGVLERLSRGFAEKYLPDEVLLFDTVWAAFARHRGQVGQPADADSVAFAAAGPGTLRSLHLSTVLPLFSAVVHEAGARGVKTQEEVRQLLAECSARLSVPPPILRAAVEYLPPLVLADVQHGVATAAKEGEDSGLPKSISMTLDPAMSVKLDGRDLVGFRGERVFLVLFRLAAQRIAARNGRRNSEGEPMKPGLLAVSLRDPRLRAVIRLRETIAHCCPWLSPARTRELLRAEDGVVTLATEENHLDPSICNWGRGTVLQVERRLNAVDQERRMRRNASAARLVDLRKWVGVLIDGRDVLAAGFDAAFGKPVEWAHEDDAASLLKKADELLRP